MTPSCRTSRTSACGRVTRCSQAEALGRPDPIGRSGHVLPQQLAGVIGLGAVLNQHAIRDNQLGGQGGDQARQGIHDVARIGVSELSRSRGKALKSLQQPVAGALPRTLVKGSLDIPPGRCA
jgi:hypothetical protein